MPRPDIKIHRVGFEKAVAHLTVDCELRRASWSHDPADDNFRHPLRIDLRSGRLMRCSCGGHHWDSFTLTPADVLAKDWEVRRAPIV